MHDLIASDRRNPTVNGYGPLYGSTEYSTDNLPILDPETNTASTFHAPVRDPDTARIARPRPRRHEHTVRSRPPIGAMNKMWDSKVNNHNSMIDQKGRVWLAAAIRAADNPAFCKRGSDNPSAKLFPIEKNVRQIGMLDPKTMKYTFVDTCFGTHHLQFGYDANNTVWASGGGPVLGWVNTKMFDETGDAAKSQGWTAFVLDTNGNGKRDEDYVQPNQPVDPEEGQAHCRRILCGDAKSGRRLDMGDCRRVRRQGRRVARRSGSEPAGNGDLGNLQYPAAGLWAARRRYRQQRRRLGVARQRAYRQLRPQPLQGTAERTDSRPAITAPRAGNSTNIRVLGLKASAITALRRAITAGSISTIRSVLANDVPMSTGNLNDGLIALKDGKMVTLRVPYPMGFYAKGFDGRIDDPNAGWKGRGLWTSSGDRTPWLKEGGKGRMPMVVHFQLRPDPLAH